MLFWICVSLLVVFSLFMRFRRCSPNTGPRGGKARKPIEDVLKSSPGSTPYKSPTVSPIQFTGKWLRVSSHIIHTATGQLYILPFLYGKNNTDLLAGEFIPEEPTFSPTMASNLIRSDKPNADGSNKEILESLVQQYDSASNCRRTSMDFYNAYKSGSCEPLDVARCVLKAIAQSNSSQDGVPLQAIIQVNEEDVLSMARASTERWANSEPLSYLDGVPISIKGMFVLPPNYDCKIGASFKSMPLLALGTGGMNQGVVSQLKAAGAVIIGMANLNEFCTGVTGSNPAFKPARNPYNTSHFCGGSSSGSGCSVSAGLCPISIGSDAGGSIRIPAAYCGVVGLKPTFKLLDKAGSAQLTHTVSVVGPLTSSVLDATIVMDILCSGKGTFDLDSYSNGTTLNGVKLGVFWDFFNDADKEIVKVCKEVVEQMQVSMGASCVEIEIPELAETRAAHIVTTSTEFGNSLLPDVDAHFDEICGETLQVLAFGRNTLAKDYINAQKQRTRSIRILKHIFESVDVIVTPTVSRLPPEIIPGAEKTGLGSIKLLSESLRFMHLANLTGIPGIAVPVGMSSSGLPVSLQIMGPWYEEGRLLHVASKVEEEFASRVKRPQVYYDVLDLAN